MEKRYLEDKIASLEGEAQKRNALDEQVDSLSLSPSLSLPLSLYTHAHAHTHTCLSLSHSRTNISLSHSRTNISLTRVLSLSLSLPPNQTQIEGCIQMLRQKMKNGNQA